MFTYYARVDKKINEVSNKMQDIVEQTLFDTLTDKIPEVKESLISTYNKELVDVVANTKSKTRPEEYLEDYENRLDGFEFVTISNGEVIFSVPDMENFDFSGRLRVIESILEGVIGNYVEVDGEQWERIFGKRKIPTDPVDSTVPIKERMYLLRYNQFIKNKEDELDTKFIKYPFSNVGPIDIFTETEEYVEENMSGWMEEAINHAQNKLKEDYR